MHHVESKWGRRGLATLGLLASATLLLASGSMNFSYGCSMATTTVNCYIYGSAAAAGDVLMALSPFFFFAAWRNREYVQCFAALAVWVITTVFAAQSAVGHSAFNRLGTASSREVASVKYKDVRTELEQARSDRKFLPQHRTEAELNAEISKLKTSSLWFRTEECNASVIAGKAQREFCAGYQTLNAELGTALQSSKLDARIQALVEKSDKASSDTTTVNAEADPQAKTIARLTGATFDTAQGWSIAIGALMILGCAGLGPYASVSVLQRTRRGDPPPLPMGELPTGALVPDPPKSQRLLAGPVRQPLDPNVITVRSEPSPEWRSLLDRVDFPPAGARHKGPLRPRLDEDVQALRFLVWAGAYGEHGEMPATVLDDLYTEFLNADHRELTAMRQVKGELEAISRGKIASKRQVVGQGTLWTLNPPPIDKLIVLLEKAKVVTAPEPEQPATTEATPANQEEPAKRSASSILPFLWKGRQAGGLH